MVVARLLRVFEGDSIAEGAARAVAARTLAVRREMICILKKE